MTERFFCVNCDYFGILDIHLKCPKCQSDSVCPAEGGCTCYDEDAAKKLIESAVGE